MNVTVCGTSSAILDIGEQLAWLSAALRASETQQQLLYCTPSIRDRHGLFQIDVSSERLQKNLGANGPCWHQLFFMPAVVKGFPITRKSQPHGGIEIPLRIMAALLGTAQTDEFNNKMFLKGFSKMAVPVKKDGETVYWHMYSNADGERISFLHATAAHASDIDVTDMERCRHVLGWTSNAEFHAGKSGGSLGFPTPPLTTYRLTVSTTGSPFANYNIANSYLDSPSPGCSFSGLSVSQGSPISGGPSFVICHKDADLVPVIGRNGHVRRMRWIAKQMLLLWDNDQRTGWLVNGVGALLHLVRASLHNDRADMFSPEMLLKLDQLWEPDVWSATAPARFLMDSDNLSQIIFDEENGTLEARVDLFYNILEKLIEYQKLMAGDDGAKMQGTRRDILQGWDFHDIIMKSDDRIFPRSTILDAAGKSWVDFVRSLSAVTLFGRGYGQLIKPVDASLCSRWKEIPPGRSYIAASMLDLRGLIHLNSSSPNGRAYMGRHFVWHTESALLEGCRCDDDDDRHQRYEPVQSLLPRSMDRSLPARTSAIRTTDSGALIFGQHSGSPFIWNDLGPPIERKATASNTPITEGATSPGESDIGSSIKSESTSDTPMSGSDNFDLSQRCQEHSAYAIGIICALERELKVVRSLLDETFTGPGAVYGDRNIYVYGRMGRHLVVCASLPSGNYGNSPAVMCAENMRRTFWNIQCCIVVGVGGGIPSPSQDVRLGDVVVGQGVGDIPAVIQYDRGKELDEGRFERTGNLSDPPVQLLNAISSLKSDPRLPQGFLKAYVEQIIDGASEADKAKYAYPETSQDVLHGSHERPTRPTIDPIVHYGPIASGNRVIKSAAFRDNLAQLGALCFDMEAGGVALSFPSKTLVVRGICDYSDSQKNKDWQDYAAANAAAYVKHLLSLVPAVSYLGKGLHW
jgi:nucleoside phosphorylase